MSGRYVLTPSAQADVDEIWDYAERRWGFGQAETYIRQLNRDIEIVASQPARGRPCLEIRREYQRYPSRLPRAVL